MFSGETVLEQLPKCVFEGNPQPNVTIETADGLIFPHKIVKKAKKHKYNAVPQMAFTWKLEYAGNASCKVYYENSNVEAVAQAAINGKKSYKKIRIQPLLTWCNCIVYPFIKQGPTDVTKLINVSRRFECIAAGYPTPQILWQKSLNGQPYKFFSKQTEENFFNETTISSTIELTNSISSAGDYRCVTKSDVTTRRSYPENLKNESDSVQYSS